MSASGVDRTPVGYQVRFYRTKCEIAAPLAINGCCLVTSSNKATWPDFAGRRRTQHAESCILSLYNITPPRHPRDLTDEQWNILEPFIPVPTCREDGRGRPWKDRRAVLNGILWVLRTGAPWADLPNARFFGSSGFLVGGQRVAGSSILPTRRRPQSHRSPKGGQEIPKYPTRQSGRGQLVKGIRH